MKQRREADMVVSEIRAAINELSILAVDIKNGSNAAVVDDIDNEDATTHDNQTSSVAVVQVVPIKPFLSLCNLLIQVLDKIGPTMAVLRQDIHQNIQRLDKFYETDPSKYWDVVEILKKEVNEGTAKKGPTCSKSFVWLTRSLGFTLALLELLVKDFDRNMEQAVEQSYNITLKPWHGWISSAAYKVALKLVPDSRTLLDVLKDKDQDYDKLKEEMQKLISLLVPLLEHNNNIMREHGLDKLKST